MHLPFILKRCVLVGTVFRLSVFQVQVYDNCNINTVYTDANIEKAGVTKDFIFMNEYTVIYTIDK